MKLKSTMENGTTTLCVTVLAVAVAVTLPGPSGSVAKPVIDNATNRPIAMGAIAGLGAQLTGRTAAQLTCALNDPISSIGVSPRCAAAESVPTGISTGMGTRVKSPRNNRKFRDTCWVPDIP